MTYEEAHALRAVADGLGIVALPWVFRQYGEHMVVLPTPEPWRVADWERAVAEREAESKRADAHAETLAGNAA